MTEPTAADREAAREYLRSMRASRDFLMHELFSAEELETAFLVGVSHARLTWAGAPPTEVPGWYWVRGEPDLNAVIVWVSTSGYILRTGFPQTSTAGFMRENPRGQFAGPISVPSEPRQ